jgi:branched-chain amino acid transport system permease protein
VLYFVLFAHVVRSDEEHRIKNSLLIGFGLSLIAQTLATHYFTGDPRAIPYSSESWRFFGLVLPLVRASNLFIGIIIVISLQFFMNRTYIGKAIRATAEDWQTASLTGINIRNMYLITFSLGAALAGLSGMLLAVQQSLTPTTGLRWTLNSLIVVVLAGLGSIPGTFIAGMLLGLAEASSTLIFDTSQYREMAGLVIFVVILSVRSQGLFGEQHA